MNDSRTRNTKRNIVFSFLDTIFVLAFQFISRSIIVFVFSKEYLGLSSLFASILQVLNMADLGFSGAIVYNIYKPLAENDINTVCSLMNYYKKVYRIVGVVVLVLGMIVIPIIPQLIKGEIPDGINIYALYGIYLTNTVLSYFLFAYKSALLNALQRMDLTKIAYTVASFIQYLLQIVLVLLFQNYYLFMICVVLGTAFKNLFCAYISKKKFPEFECRGNISSNLKKDIITRVKGLLICNISAVTYTTFDSILLSAFFGLSSVAIYNNYIVVFNGVMNLIVMIRSAMQASVGNSIAIETKEKNYQDMLLWQFFFSIIACGCVTCMINLYQPFMIIWMGEENLLSFVDVVLICVWFYFSIIPHAFYLYMSGNGLWWEMRYPYIFSTICNLLLNAVLGKIFGVTGIIFSTVFSQLFFGIVWQCIILFKKYYKDISLMSYFLKQFVYLLVGIISTITAIFANSFVTLSGITGIVVRMLICIIVFVLSNYIFFRNTKIYERSKMFIISLLR